MFYFSWLFILLTATPLFLPTTLLRAEQTQVIHFNFSKDYEGWVGDFTDYPVHQEAFFELEWGWKNLPQPLSTTFTKGMFLSGNNHSDDLFMFLKRHITNLEPNTLYALTWEILIENNIPPGEFGIGGSPGESVYFKVGASTKKPKKVNVNGFYQLNVDKGNQSQGGKNAIVVGNLANPLVDPLNPQYFPKQFLNETPLLIKTDRQGGLWIFLGTDSGFEGPTNYYISEIILHAKPLAKSHLDKKKQKQQLSLDEISQHHSD